MTSYLYVGILLSLTLLVISVVFSVKHPKCTERLTTPTPPTPTNIPSFFVYNTKNPII